MNKWFEKILSNNKVLSFLFIIIIIFGIKSVIGLKKDVFPLTDIDTMIIHITSQGSSAKDVEVNAVIPIEQKIKEISEIKSYNSISNPNGALIYLYLDRNRDNPQRVKNEIFRTITLDNIENIGPDVDEIKIIDANPRLMPVINLALTSKNQSSMLDQFSIARKIRNSLQRIPGVSEVRTTGLEDPEIHIEVNPKLLAKNYIAIEDVWIALKNRNVHQNGGSLQSLKSNKTIITVNRFSNLKEIENVVLRSNFSGQEIQIKDIASVNRKYSKEKTISRVGGKRAVIFQVTKKEAADVLTVVKQVRKWLDKNKGKSFLKKYQLVIVSNKGKTIKSMLGVVTSNALIGFILVFLCLLFFLDLKTSFWTATGIPVSLLLVTIGMDIFDISINVITLGAIITVLGMLVDDGIVVGETMFNSREQNLDKSQTAQELARLFWPLSVTIGTTIVAFLPLAHMGGLMGKFIKFYPVVISLTLIASLFESSVLLPHHLQSNKPAKQKKWFIYFRKKYELLLTSCLKHAKLTTFVFIVFLIIASFLGAKSFKKFILLYDDSSEGIYVNVELPAGETITRMDNELDKLRLFVSKNISDHDLLNIQTFAGHHTVKRIRSEGYHENWGQLLVTLIPRAERKRTAKEIIKKLTKKIKSRKWSFSSLVLEEQALGPNPGKGVEVVISGKKHQNRLELLGDLETFALQQNGVAFIDKRGVSSTNEIKLEFNFQEMARLGINVTQISQTIRAAFNGVIATEDPLLDYTLNYRVLLPKEKRGSEEILKDLLILNNEKHLVPLKKFTKFKSQKGVGQIHHTRGLPNLLMKIQTQSSKLTPRQMAKKIKTWWVNNKTSYKNMTLAIKGEAKETKDSMVDLFFAMIISIALIYMILVILFNSYSIPFIIFSVLPFGVSGAVIAFVLHSIPLNFMGLVGIIGLSGILVNDAIILVNTFLKNKSIDAKKAATSRFRPILLTTVTTVVGLLPSVYGIGGDVKTLVPVVIALSFGLISGTIANLVLLPLLLSKFRISSSLR
ncbi:MAG: efflux RND transporter permease subunit [Bacteriovoracaceae bacterium]|nr:efflux RND transporter permease subunit [Bacteriovoracaceae bacterium]